MLKSYFRVAIFNLLKNKVNSFINILGLAIGIASCAVILMYVLNELRYDRFHANTDNFYRVAILKDTDGLNRGNASVPYRTAEVLLNEYPEVVEAGRLVNMFQQDPVVKIEDQLFIEKEFYFVDPSILRLFSVSFLKGDPATALIEPNSIVLSEAIAQKYFGSINVLGKTISTNMNEVNTDFKITGIVENCPKNSHFKYQLLAPLDNYFPIVVPFFRERVKSWYMLPFWTYVKLKPGTSPDKFEAKLTQVVKNNFPSGRQDSQYFLQPVKEIHLHSHIDAELEANSDIVYIYIFSAIAILVLLIACINFMNLTTARSINRAKEVGLRKVLGAQRQQLIKQFLFESILTAFLAVLIAFGLVDLFRILLNSYTAVNIELNYIDPQFIILAVGFVVFVGFASGLYPAFFLSGFQPIKTLKGVFARTASGKGLRTSLVVAQMAITVVLLVAILTISQQLNFIQNKKLGFDKEQMLLINLRGTALTNTKTYESFKNRLEQLPDVKGVTKSMQMMGHGAAMRSVYFYGVTEDEKIVMPYLTVGHDFASTYNLEIVKGRDISSQVASDTNHIYLVNEAAVKQFNLNPVLGRIITTGDAPKEPGPIVGIVKDFHYGPLHESIGPLVIGLWNRPLVYISVNLRADSDVSSIGQIEKIWGEFETNRAMDFSFLEDRLNRVYQFESMLGKVVTAFTGLAVLIAGLGLFGMALYTAEQRTKEIGIRKVLGASIQNIIYLISLDFVKWMLIANLFAWPIAFFMIREWLNDFAYRIELGIEVFLLAGLSALVLTLITVSSQLTIAAFSNPVETLRYE